MRFFALAMVLVLTACTHASVRMSTDGTTTTTGTSVSAGYSGHGSAGFWALIGIGLMAAEVGGGAAARERGLDATRQVNEVDCTKPIENWSANLKCR